MKFADVLYEKKERVAILTLDDQKKLNALSPGIRQGLKEGFAEAEKDPDVKVAIVTGAGRAFCAGADITGFGFDPVSVLAFLDDVFQALAIGENVKKPVIAAVNGLALGGGFEVAMSCDIIIASEKARFGVPEINLGLLPGFAIIRLHQIIGRSKSKEMTMTGEPISAEEAFRLNLVSKVVPHEKLMDEAMELAKKIASKPAIAIRLAKSSINRMLGGEEIVYASDAMPSLFATEDTREGITAFLEKRKPVFKDR
ncbi:MAG: enoyl-CoA hydratase-related protein [Pseudomonadota bacterium]